MTVGFAVVKVIGDPDKNIVFSGVVEIINLIEIALREK